ncbi:ThiS family protein [Planctomycetes bacterium MalM25]|nr:ThiS family protein [Planctomycetes bacterium MalM25]
MLLFGPQAALAGEREIIVTAEEPTAGRVLEALAQASETLAPSLAASRLAVNHKFVGDEHPIRPGDEVALIGMVSGG